MGTVTRLDNVARARGTLREEQAAKTSLAIRWRGRGERNARIQQYRQKAEELRSIADDVILHETKQTLLSLSCSYEHMADALERMQVAED